tara:strand:+ start:1104 stop:1805 length:702 start_codon:yes stop_codon:yes gene_type:complete
MRLFTTLLLLSSVSASILYASTGEGGVYKSELILIPQENAEYQLATEWKLELLEDGRFSCLRRYLRNYSTDNAPRSALIDEEGFFGNWEINEKKVVLDWMEKVTKKVRVTIRDLSKNGEWKSKDGRIVHGRLNWQYAAHVQFHRYTPNSYIPIIRDDNRGLKKTTILHKQLVDGDLWGDWVKYRDARLANLPLDSIKEYDVDEAQRTILTRTGQGDLILNQNGGKFIRLNKIK